MASTSRDAPNAVDDRGSRANPVSTATQHDPPEVASAETASTEVTNDGIGGGLRRFARISRWDLWSKPAPMIAFLLSWEVLAAGALALGMATSGPVTGLDWARFAGLAVCATVHIQLTRRQEERRRNRLAAVHIDLSGIWVFPGALLLPIELTLLLILVVRVQRWVNSRRPPHKFLFTSFTHAVSALLAQRFFVAVAPPALIGLDQLDALRVFGLLLLTGLIYAAVQAVAIGTLLALGGTTQRTLKNVLGSKTDNLLDAATIGMGIVTTILLVTMPAAVVVLVLVGVVGNRLAEISQLQEDAQTDPKTGVLNMRGWSESAQRAFIRSSRAGDRVALLMVDFDYFKWINDTFGHPAGDDVLRHMGHLLEEVTRPSDVVGRFGGEEFIVLLPDTDTDAAAHIADRIGIAINKAEIDTTTKRGGQTTISDRSASIGVAVYPENGTSLEDLLHAADAAVYEAKERGRNQVRFATAVPRPPD